MDIISSTIIPSTLSLVHVNIKKVRKKGNRCLQEQNCVVAAKHYTNYMDVDLLQLRERSSNSSNNINVSVLHAYSNRLKMWLQMKELKKVLEES